MTKFLFGIVMIAFTSFCGYLLARKYRQRKLFFRQLYEFNERFLTEIAYYRRPIQEFAAKYTYRGEFAELLERFFEGLNEEVVQENTFLDKAHFSFLKEEERRAVEDYFLMLGRGDSVSQRGYFSSVKEELYSESVVAEKACKKYADLYIKIGFLCGLLLLILMI